MRTKITQRALDALRPMDRVYEVADTEVQGFTVRVMPSGAKSYSVRYRLPNGKQDRMRIALATECTLSQAKDRARAILASVVQGSNPVEVKQAARRNLTLKEFVETVYLPWCLSHVKTRGEMPAAIKSAFPGLLAKKLDEINAWQIEKWRRARLEAGNAGATTNRRLTYLKAALTRAVDWGFLAEHPLRGKVKQLPESAGRVRFLDAAERIRLMDALDAREEAIRAGRDRHNAWCRARSYPELPNLRAVDFADHLRPMVLLSLDTGVRRGELFSLEWTDVDFDRAQLLVRAENTKTHTGRYVPLTTAALGTLTKWRAQSAEDAVLVFQNPATGERFHDIKKGWEAVRHAAKLDDFCWHDLRHTFASSLVQRGVDLFVVMRLLGHSNVKTTMRYAHLRPDDLSVAIRVLDRPDNIVPMRGQEEARA